MADDRPAGEGPTTELCPWCSAALPAKPGATCPSCGATLTAESEPQVPGVTTVSPESFIRAGQQRRPNRLVQWITGESGDSTNAASPPTRGSLEPPPRDVKVEMLRLEIAARLAARTAEVDELETEARLQAGESGTMPGTEPTGDESPEAPATQSADEPISTDAARPHTWAELDARGAAASNEGEAGAVQSGPADGDGNAPEPASGADAPGGASGPSDRNE